MEKYLAIEWSTDRIKKIEIERESDKSIWRRYSHDGMLRQERKITESCGYFDTWQEAKDFLLKLADAEVQKARSNLEYYSNKYGNVKGLKQ